MNSPIGSLIRKEWSEWRLLAGILLGIVLIAVGHCVAQELQYQAGSPYGFFATFGLCYAFLAAVLVGVLAATGEASRGTHLFTAALPVSLRTTAAVRIGMAFLTTFGPLCFGGSLLAGLVACDVIDQARPEVTWDLRNPYMNSIPVAGDWGLTALGAWSSMSWLQLIFGLLIANTLVCILAIGIVLCNEGALGAAGVCIILFMVASGSLAEQLEISGFTGLANSIRNLVPLNWVAVQRGYGYDGMFARLIYPTPGAIAVVVNAGATIMAAFAFIRLYGVRVDLGISQTFSRLFPRLNANRVTANIYPELFFQGVYFEGEIGTLVWVNSRKAIPLAVAGLSTAACLALVAVLSDSRRHTPLHEVFGGLATVCAFFGSVWAILLGIAMYNNELQGGLARFLRSLPISLAKWFWVKFVVGALVLIITLDFVPLTIGLCLSDRRQQLIAIGMCSPFIHLVAYSLGILAICILRRSATATILATVVLIGIDAIQEILPFEHRVQMFNTIDHMEQILTGYIGPRITNEYLRELADYYQFCKLTVCIASIAALGAWFLTRRSAVCVLLITVFVTVDASVQACGEPPSAEDASRVKKLLELADGFQQRATGIERVEFDVRTTPSRSPLSFEVFQEIDPASVQDFLSAYLSDVNGYTATFSNEYQMVRYGLRDQRMFLTHGERFAGRFDRKPLGPMWVEGTIAVSKSQRRPNVFSRPHELNGHIWLRHVDYPGLSAKFVSWNEFTEKGEEFIEFDVMFGYGWQTAEPDNSEDAEVPTRKRLQISSKPVIVARYQVTINVTRGFWPVSIVSRGDSPMDRKGKFAYVTWLTADGWLESEGSSIPNSIVRKYYYRSTSPLERIEVSELEDMETIGRESWVLDRFVANPPVPPIESLSSPKAGDRFIRFSTDTSDKLAIFANSGRMSRWGAIVAPVPHAVRWYYAMLIIGVIGYGCLWWWKRSSKKAG